MFSAASIWEIAIKSTLRRRDFRVAPGDILAAAIESGLSKLPVRSTAAAHVATLPAPSSRPVRQTADRTSGHGNPPSFTRPTRSSKFIRNWFTAFDRRPAGSSHSEPPGA